MTTMDWGDTGQIGHERLNRLLRDIRGGMVGTTELARAEGTNRHMIAYYLARFRPLREALALVRMRADWHPNVDNRCPTCDGTGWPVAESGQYINEQGEVRPFAVRHRCEDCEGLRTRWWARTPDDLPPSYRVFLENWAQYGQRAAMELCEVSSSRAGAILSDAQYRMKASGQGELRNWILDWLDSRRQPGAY